MLAEYFWAGGGTEATEALSFRLSGGLSGLRRTDFVKKWREQRRNALSRKEFMELMQNSEVPQYLIDGFLFREGAAMLEKAAADVFLPIGEKRRNNYRMVANAFRKEADWLERRLNSDNLTKLEANSIIVLRLSARIMKKLSVEMPPRAALGAQAGAQSCESAAELLDTIPLTDCRALLDKLQTDTEKEALQYNLENNDGSSAVFWLSKALQLLDKMVIEAETNEYLEKVKANLQCGTEECRKVIKYLGG